MKLNTLDIVALVLVIVGGLNWLFVALGFNLVTIVVGFSPVLVDIVYWLVGLSAIYLAVVAMKLEKQ